MLLTSETIFDSPAVALLCELEDAARETGAELTAAVLSDGKLRIAPAAVLTPARVLALKEHRDALRLLVLVNDPAVVARRDVFARYLETYTGGAIVPALRFVRSGPVQPGRCYSCAEKTAALVWCPACQMAARLARGCAVPSAWTPSMMPSSAANPKVSNGF